MFTVSRRLGRGLLLAAGWALLAVRGLAIIGAAYQMQLGNPSTATSDTSNHNHYLIQRDQYAMDYNDTRREPNWVSWDLTTADVGGSGRTSFAADPGLPAGFTAVATSATPYSTLGYDRGHMCPSGDRTVTVADNNIVFYMSNMIPQASDNNQGVWASLENDCRTFAGQGNELLITCGPSGFSGGSLSNGVAIPDYTWKIILVVPLGSGPALSRVNSATRVIAVKIPNIAGIRSDPWQNYLTTIAQIQADTGFTFLDQVPAAVASVLRTKVDGATSVGLPAISSQPADQTAVVGGGATFTAAASGTALAYQWFKDEVLLAGATSATLTLANVQLTDGGTYTLVVSNSAGSATSSPAQLVILPAITTQPQPLTAATGGTATFSVVATGNPPLTYQWRKAGTAITGNASATTSSLTLTNVQAADAAAYDVMVSDGVNSATSASAALTVVPVFAGTVYWDFSTAAPASGLAADLTGGTITQGNNNGTTVLLTTTSASSGYTGSSGTNNAGAAARIGALNIAASGSAYFEFTLGTVTGEHLVATGLSFGSRSTSTGPQAFAVRTSADAFASDVATGTLANTSAWALKTAAFGVTGASGASLTFRLYGYNGAGSASANTANWRIDDLKLTITPVVETVPPTITQQPVNVSVVAGNSASFTASATGTPAPAFQWRKAGQAVTGNSSATTATLTIANAQPADAGSYDVVATNSAGTATSSSVSLTVIAGFDAWRLTNFSGADLLDANRSGPAAVYGLDGLPNLMKYALGLPPTTDAVTGLPQVSVTATDWVYTYQRPANRADVTFTVECSTDLVTWTSAGVTHEFVSTAGGLDTWRGRYPLASAANLYFRLKVERP
jgi:endonuclease G